MVDEFKSQNGRDPHLPGIEPMTYPEITVKARQYAAARDTRIRFLAEEIRLKEELIALMHERGIAVYREDDLIVTLHATEKVKVKIESSEEEDAEGE